MSDLNAEMVEILKNHYVTSDLTVDKLAGMSKKLVGKQIPRETINTYVKRNMWNVERNRIRSEKGSDAGKIQQELDEIRELVYKQIVQGAKKGLFLTGDFDREEVMELLSGIDGVEVSKINPRGIEPSWVNAYVNLLDKSKVIDNLKPSGVSGKTALQQAEELVAEELQAQFGRDTS